MKGNETMGKNIIIYGKYSNTAGEEYFISYEDGNKNTGNVIMIKLIIKLAE